MQKYREQLRNELLKRKKKNPKFSLRAWARILGLSSSFLSDILSGKKDLSIEKALQIARALKYDERETLAFCRLVTEANELGKIAASVDEGATNYRLLDLEYFEVIAEWYHYAILELSLCRNVRLTAANVAKAFGISEDVARLAIARLKRLKLLKSVRGGYRKSDHRVSTPTDIPSSALRRHHSELILKARNALESCEVSERDITGVTMAIDRSRLPEAKEEIRKFRRRLTEFMTTGDMNSVYQLNVQFFPLSEEETS